MILEDCYFCGLDLRALLDVLLQGLSNESAFSIVDAFPLLKRALPNNKLPALSLSVENNRSMKRPFHNKGVICSIGWPLVSKAIFLKLSRHSLYLKPYKLIPSAYSASSKTPSPKIRCFKTNRFFKTDQKRRKAWTWMLDSHRAILALFPSSHLPKHLDCYFIESSLILFVTKLPIHRERLNYHDWYLPTYKDPSKELQEIYAHSWFGQIPSHKLLGLSKQILFFRDLK